MIPRIDKLYCDVFGSKDRQIYSPLPNLYHWEFGGSATLEGKGHAHIWQRQIKVRAAGSAWPPYVCSTSPSAAACSISLGPPELYLAVVAAESGREAPTCSLDWCRSKRL